MNDTHSTRPVDVRGLTKMFGSFTALDGVDMTVEQGTVHGFLGPNGAGKSTTIRVLLGLYKPTGGNVSVLGMDPSTRAAEVTRDVSYVPGDVALWPNLTGRQVLDLLAQLRASGSGAAPYDRAREAELVERFALDPSKKVGTYSTGNRQKVMLVAAFAAPTYLLILDEPTSGLDPLMEQVFADCVRKATGDGRTILLSSHLLAEVERLCTHVTIVADGRVVESGSLEGMRHLAAVEVRVRAEDEVLGRLAGDVPGARRNEDVIVADVEREHLSEVLASIARSGATDVTINPASLESLFLRHYEVAAR